MFHHFNFNQTNVFNPTFKVLSGFSGLNNLEPELIIDGYTESPLFLYKGQGATATEWTPEVGEVLDPVVVDGFTFDDGVPFTNSEDRSVYFDGVGSFTATGNNDFANITTEDIVIEIVFNSQNPGSNRGFFGKQGGSTGWRIWHPSGVVRFDIWDGVGTSNVNTGSLANGWYHVMVFVNRDEASTSGSQCYVNGVATGSGVDLSARAGSSTSATPFVLGATAGQAPNVSQVAYVAGWIRSDWHQASTDGPTEWAAIAQERFARLTGVYPQKAEGTLVPSLINRNSIAYSDIRQESITTLYKVGADWPRFITREDLVGSFISGYLGEIASTNLCRQSEDFSITPWFSLNEEDFIADGYTAPNEEDTADGLVAGATLGSHGVSQQITLTAAIHVFSIYAQAGDKNWLYLANQTVSDCDGYFNLSNATIGTIGSGVGTSFVENLGNNWVRCGIRFTGTAADHTFTIQPANDNSDSTFSGDETTTNTYIWGAQVELSGYGDMTSYIPTTTGSATRNFDELQYTSTDNINMDNGTFVADVLLPNSTTVAGARVISTTNDGTLNNRIDLQVFSDHIRNLIIDGGVSQADIQGSTDVVDGYIYHLATSWQTDDIKAYVDLISEGTPDTSATMPSGATVISIGNHNATTSAGTNGIISNFKIFNRPCNGE